MPYFPRAVDDPRSMPELRAALIEMALPNSVWVHAELEKLAVSIAGPTAIHHEGHTLIAETPVGLTGAEMARRMEIALAQSNNTVRWYWEQFPKAQMIHVTEEMTDFIVAAAEAVPERLTLTLEDAPSPGGFVVFAKPVMGTDAGPERPGKEVRVDGILWAPINLPARDVAWYDERAGELLIPGVSIASFRMLAPEHEDVLAEQLEIRDVMWVPLGRSDWPWGDEMGRKPSDHLPNESDEQWLSILEDRRLLAALWATINQKRLVTTEDVQPRPHARKRLMRAGHTADQTVQIIHLRRTEYQALERTEGGRKVSVRFPVKPHYRRQAYGPGRSLRRIVLVPAHWRGPDDAPITHVERIWEVDR